MSWLLLFLLFCCFLCCFFVDVVVSVLFCFVVAAVVFVFAVFVYVVFVVNAVASFPEGSLGGLRLKTTVKVVNSRIQFYNSLLFEPLSHSYLQPKFDFTFSFGH